MKYVLFLMMVLFSGQAVALNCAQAPDCAELGYSNVDDPNCKDDGYLICPFDSDYKKCVELNCQGLGYTQSDKSAWCEEIIYCPQDNTYSLCKTLQLQCEIGDVFYADRTCGKAAELSKSTKKTPVGIVYYVEEGGRHGRVMALNGLTGDENHNFDPKNPFHNTNNPLVQGFELYDVPAIQNVTTLLSSRLNGQEETKILAQTVMPNCPYDKGTFSYHQYCVGTQARAALAFYPPETSVDNPYVGAGHWYQPAIGELLLLTENDAWNIVLKTVDKLKAAGVDVSYPCYKDRTDIYWKHCTSTTDSTTYMTSYEFTESLTTFPGGRDNGGEIRPILAY